MGTKPIPPKPRGYGRWGEYAIDELKVRVLGDNLAFITCDKYMVNSPHYDWRVSVGWFDRRKGVTLEQKIEEKKAEIIQHLERENKKIRHQREMQDRLNKK